MEEFETMKVKTSRSLYHSIVDHNFWIDRHGQCPYCVNGSKPVHKKEMELLVP